VWCHHRHHSFSLEDSAVATHALTGDGRPVQLRGGLTLHAPDVRGTVADEPPMVATARVTTTALDAALAAAGMRTARTLSVAGHSTSVRAARPSRSGRAEIVLDVPAPASGRAQLVLAIDELGGTSWHLPRRLPRRASTTQLATAPRERFRIDARLGDGRVATRVMPSRLPLGRLIVRLLIYPIGDRLLGPIDRSFAARWEAAKRPQSLTLVEGGVIAPSPRPAPSAEDWMRLAQGRALLLLHGTFSSALGAFAALDGDILGALSERYEGRVLAADLFTLSVDPDANARWIRSLVPSGVRVEVDVISHSRGGLVARALAASPREDRDASSDAGELRVRRIVHVGTPNRGTPLADADHVGAMIDRYTTALQLLPESVAAEALEAVITAVKVLAHAALSSLPGLATMRPGGAYLRRLRRRTNPALQYAIVADYSPLSGTPFFKLVVERVGDRVVDRVFGEHPNDLVVPARGVGEERAGKGFPLPRARRILLPSSLGIMHTEYFAAPEVGRLLLRWLSASTSTTEV
jgi:hypothetical protein